MMTCKDVLNNENGINTILAYNSYSVNNEEYRIVNICYGSVDDNEYYVQIVLLYG